jgi:hypothetical protein
LSPLFYAMLFFILHNPHWFHDCSLWTKCHNSWFLSLLFSWHIFVTFSYFLFKCIFIFKMFLTDHMYISLLIHSKYFFPFSLFIQTIHVKSMIGINLLISTIFVTFFYVFWQYLQDKCSTTWLLLSPLFALVIFQIGSHFLTQV